MKDCSLDKQHPVGFSFLLGLALLFLIVALPKSSGNPVLKTTLNTIPGLPPVQYFSRASGTTSPANFAAKVSGSSAPTFTRLKPVDKTLQTKIVASYAKLPLHFEANAGQTDPKVKFLSRGAGYTLFLTGAEAVFAFRAWNDSPQQRAEVAALHDPAVISMKLVGANPTPLSQGLDELPGKSNYLRGNNLEAWQTGLPQFDKVKFSNVYDGIDLLYYGSVGRLEYDFIVSPGADPHRIQLAFDGVDGTLPGARGYAPPGQAPEHPSENASKTAKNIRRF
jgi:hypothetical protein